MNATVEAVNPVMPRIFDELWDERGPAVQACTLAVMEAQADTDSYLGSAT